MRKIINVNLYNIRNMGHVFSRFIKALGITTVDWFNNITDENAELYNEKKVSSDAFNDDLIRLEGYPGYEDIENMELHLIISGWSDVEKILLPKDVENLKDILEHQSKLHPYKEDPEYLEKLNGMFRYDALKKFSYEIKLD